MNRHRSCYFAWSRVVAIILIAALGVASYVPAAATVSASPSSHPTYTLLKQPALGGEHWQLDVTIAGADVVKSTEVAGCVSGSETCLLHDAVSDGIVNIGVDLAVDADWQFIWMSASYDTENYVGLDGAGRTPIEWSQADGSSLSWSIELDQMQIREDFDPTPHGAVDIRISGQLVLLDDNGDVVDSEPIQAYIDIMLYRQSWLRLDWFGSPPEGQACYGEFDAEAPAGWTYKSWIPGQAIALETSVGELVSASDRTDLRGCIDFLLLVAPQEWAQVTAADGTPGNLMAATITAQTRGDVPLLQQRTQTIKRGWVEAYTGIVRVKNALSGEWISVQLDTPVGPGDMFEVLPDLEVGIRMPSLTLGFSDGTSVFTRVFYPGGTVGLYGGRLVIEEGFEMTPINGYVVRWLLEVQQDPSIAVEMVVNDIVTGALTGGSASTAG